MQLRDLDGFYAITYFYEDGPSGGTIPLIEAYGSILDGRIGGAGAGKVVFTGFVDLQDNGTKFVFNSIWDSTMSDPNTVLISKTGEPVRGLVEISGVLDVHQGQDELMFHGKIMHGAMPIDVNVMRKSKLDVK